MRTTATNYFLILILIIGGLTKSQLLQAQEAPIKGKVILSETGEALEGASILLMKNNAQSPVVAGNLLAVSDAQGFFSIKGEQGDTLRITYLNRAPSLQVIKDPNQFLTIALEPAIFMLIDPVVVQVLPQYLMATSHLSSLELHRDDNTSILPALNRVPGLFAHQGTRSTSRITLRGMGARSPYGTSRLRAYYGDIPLTDAEGTTTVEDLDLNQIQSITVVRGPVEGMYGAGLGGALLLKPTINSNSGGRASFSYGAFNTFRSAVALHYKGLNAQFSHIHSDGFRQNNQYDRYAGSITGRWLAEEGKTTLELLALGTSLQSQIPSSINEEDYTNNPTLAASNWAAAQGREDYTKGIFGVSINRIYSPNIQHITTLFANVFSQEEAAPFAFMLSQNFAVGGRTRLEGRNEVWGKKLNWQLGTEIYQEWRRYSEYENLYTQQAIGALEVDNSQQHASYNFFGKASIFPDRKLEISLGANLQVATRQLKDFYTLDSVDLGGTYAPAPIFSPRLSIAYYWNDFLHFFLNFAHGFSMPTAAEIQLPDGGFNTSIRPEQGYNVELMVEASLFKLINLNLVAYHLQVRDLLVARRTTQNRYIGLNAGQTQHTGLEVDLSIEVQPSSKVYLHPFANYSWSYHTFVDFEDRGEQFGGNALTGVPPHVLTAGLDYSWTLKEGASTSEQAPLVLSGNINGRYVAGMPITDDNEVYSAAYFLLGARLALHFLPLQGKPLKFQLFAGVDNLLNSQYASMLLINANSFGGNAPRYYYPGLPRNAYVGLQVDF